jgi:hypothetical protein
VHLVQVISEPGTTGAPARTTNDLARAPDGSAGLAGRICSCAMDFLQVIRVGARGREAEVVVGARSSRLRTRGHELTSPKPSA